MKKLKAIFNLITLALTAGLLVLVTVAWYATNKTANVEAGTGSVADIDNIVDTVEYYNFASKYADSETYRVKNYVKITYGQNADHEQINFTYDGTTITGASDPNETALSFSMNP